MRTWNGGERMKQIRQVGLWGDSVMRGVVWNSESQKYKYATVNVAEEASKNLGINLENHAKMGCTATKGFHLLQRNFEKEMAYPQAALIEFGGNDCDFDWADGCGDAGCNFRSGTSRRDDGSACVAS